MTSRRDFLWTGLGLVWLGCAKPRSETPLAHLHGHAWVSGAYSHYAKAYAGVERSAAEGTSGAYRILAQKGIVALDTLQAHEVPFFIRVADDGQSFRVQREVPDRLTFRADMNAEERDSATRAWKLARENIHKDYEDVRRLDFALSELLAQISRVRYAIDEGRTEQYRLVRQLDTIDAGGTLPFELPYQVSRADYGEVLLLVLGRVESERIRLMRTEAGILAVGLCARATDAGSSSLAANVRKVLLSVLDDRAKDAAPTLAYPERSETRAELLAEAKSVRRSIGASPEYRRWLAARMEEEDSLGQLLGILDSFTGLPTSNVYRQVMRIWRGGGDYLDYLKIAAAFVPGSSGVAGTLKTAVNDTERYRGELRKLGGYRAALAQLKDPNEGRGTVAGALVNLRSSLARRGLEQQVVFLKDPTEALNIEEELAASGFGKDPLPAVPGLGAPAPR